MTDKRYLYFAYGSNLWLPRMRERCPDAWTRGGATLNGYRLVERLYADIEKHAGAHVQGVLYSVTERDIAMLDQCEGLSRGVYRRINVRVRVGLRSYTACTYLMTKAARTARRGMRYPTWYRSICSMGARRHGIEDGFEETKTNSWSLAFPATRKIMGD